MDIFELLAIMCGMMLGIVAIIIIIGLVVGSIKWTHTKCYCWWLPLQLLPWTYTGRLKNEMAWFIFPDRCDCSYHDRVDSIGEYMETIEAVLFVCIAAAVIVGFIINVWRWFLNYGYMHTVSRYRFFCVRKHHVWIPQSANVLALRWSAYCRINVMRIRDCNDYRAYLQRSKTEI